MTKGKLLFIGDAAGFEGGIERYAHQTALALRRTGYEVWFAGRGAGRNAGQFREGFDRVVPLPEVLDHSGEFRLAALHKPLDGETVKRLSEAFAEKLVFWAHDHDAYCPRRHYYTPLGRRNCHRPWRAFHCSFCTLPDRARAGFGGGSRAVTGFGERLELLRRLPAVVLSEFMRCNLQTNGFDPRKIHLIPPFIEADAPLRRSVSGGDGREVRLLFFGQLIRGKGTDLLLHLLSRLKCPFHAVVAGDGKDRPMMERLARQLSLSDKVEFTGWLHRPESRFADADLAVLPFRWQEPFGLTGLEAVAHGLPVVTFDLGGVREWLHNGTTGILVGPHNIALMASAIEYLGHRPAQRLAMGDSGIALARTRFSRERFLDHMENLIGRLS